MKIFDLQEIETRELEKVYNPPKYSDRELIEIFPEAVPYLKMRLGFLKKKAKALQFEILGDFIKVYTKKYLDDFSKWFSEAVVKQIKGGDLKDLQSDIKKLTFLLDPPKEIKSAITPAMIERAKNVPFDSLIKFNRAGFTHCVFHKEKSPSLHFNKRKNKVKCFGCGYSADTIKFVMDLYKLSFPEAVKKLS